jgi:transposase
MTDAVEEALYRQRQNLFGKVSIAFFDTTSPYFEDAGGDKLGRRGHSKDYRPHLKQVVLGIKLSALRVALRYRKLLAVGNSFKTAKTVLDTRPILHRTDAAVRGHIFCTFLALVLHHELVDRLAARGTKPLEWHSIIGDLVDLRRGQGRAGPAAAPSVKRS